MTKFQEEQIWEITQELNRSYELRTEYNKVFNELEENSLLPYFEKMEEAYIKAIKNLKERNENL